MSKIVSVKPGVQAVLFKKTTAFASRVSGRTHLHSTTGAVGPPPGPEIPQDAVFFAPLTSDLKDYVNDVDGTFTRNSDQTYLKDGTWRIAGPNVPAFGDGGYVMEVDNTNRCSNYNASPETSLVDVNGNGATVTAVSNPTAIAAAGLSNLVPGGYVVELDNQTAGPITSTISGNNVPSISTVSAWVNTFGSNVDFGFEVATKISINSTSLQRFFHTEDLASASNLCFVLPAGVRIQFILNQQVRASTALNPIITQGATATKEVNVLSFDLTGVLPALTEGMVSAYLANKFPQIPQHALINTVVTRPLISVKGTGSSLIYTRTRRSEPTVNPRGYISDGSGSLANSDWPLENQVFKTHARWSAANCQVTTTDSTGAWVDGGIQTNPVVTQDNIVRIFNRVLSSQNYDTYEISNAALWADDKGLQWLKDNA